jgi:2-keto-4-pentenoate hydratase
VVSLHLSIEVPDSRYGDFTTVGAAQLIADTACAAWLVLGPAVAMEWRTIDFAGQVVTGFRNGEEVVRGIGAVVLGDPRVALAWLVNEVSRHCGGIEAGQFVTTGTCIVPIAIAPGDRVRMDYGSLGTIEALIA